ncbi:MAG: CDP-alcohol phosphatidyltransferase family protein, partial [Gammaproteobacteria bacterium]|nr:CDP-alcohol phosphatidyltransferase family protein [Gammaproteobacteria bacterium]
TTLRLLFGVLACAALSAGGYFWSNIGALCFAVSNFLDHTDGELARLTGNMTRFGHYYDLASDALVNILLFVGIGLGLRHGPLGETAILLGVLAGAAVAAIFHMRNAIEQAVGKLDARQPHAGGMEAEDVLYLLPVISLAGQLQPFLILAAIGAPLFALWVLREFLALRGRAPT